MMERKLFLFPLLLFFAAFVLDKQLYIGGFDETFLRTATFLNYGSQWMKF
ncbi:MAG: hypothetical protein K8S54_01620 [Spirochaetia bacterium]|nr:hypothetical protein [Spirochaetia bacterium]